MQSMMCNLARLGSRVNITFDPENRSAHASALGAFLDRAVDLTAGVEDEHGHRFIFPFSRYGNLLEWVELRQTPTSVTWVGSCTHLYVVVEVTFTSPFRPRDEETSLWPGFIVTARVRPMKRMRWTPRAKTPKRIRFVFGVDRPGVPRVAKANSLRFDYDVPLAPNASDYVGGARATQVASDRSARATDWIGPASRGWRLRDGMLAAELRLRPGETAETAPLLWVGHSGSEVFEAARVPGRFHYLRRWPELADAVQYGRENAPALLERAREFDALIVTSALSDPAKHLFAQSFNSYLMNTWWVDLVASDFEGTSGREWFSVWEGNCLYNSTVDVEYNCATFYLLLWPRLLGLTLLEWTEHLKLNPRGPGRYLDHDMGAGTRANGVDYNHVMGVEEAANFLLLLLAHVRFNGDADILGADAVRKAVPDLVEYLLWTDQKGRGFPTEDVANTIDDAAPAVQFGREQTYLAVKRMAALEAALRLGKLVGGELKKRAAEAVALTKGTLKSRAWLGDHYAVCIDKDASDAVDPWSGKKLGKGEIEGWDDRHIYSSNGLLYLLMTGCLDGSSRDRGLVEQMRTDVESALRASTGPYGSGHSAGDPMNVWVSQNVWRDMAGHYLGAAVPDLAARYWDMQVWSNTRDQGKCFIDTYLNNNLSFYPRGITCAGYLMSLAGLVVDRTRGVARLRPLFRDGEIPLFALADRETGEIPVLVAKGGQYEVRGADIVKRQKLKLAIAKR